MSVDRPTPVARGSARRRSRRRRVPRASVTPMTPARLRGPPPTSTYTSLLMGSAQDT